MIGDPVVCLRGVEGSRSILTAGTRHVLISTAKHRKNGLCYYEPVNEKF